MTLIKYWRVNAVSENKDEDISLLPGSEQECEEDGSEIEADSQQDLEDLEEEEEVSNMGGDNPEVIHRFCTCDYRGNTFQLEDIIKQRIRDQEKKASHQHQDALRRELEAQVHTIRILTCEKTELQTALYYSQHAVQQLEGESRDLVSCLHDSWKFAGELEQALSAVATQKKKAGRVSPAAPSLGSLASQMEE
ncbi:golgin subfamily A member 2-like [Rhinopithecus roxellana]|uniref:golgin subfamily A member 2-like n=1 Tax=Rhinopithecus roxellana TaxID=61622 RepID=UPI0012373A23|nr:golgin subfamily A member 2-like [Rhinopithecus roxellana]